MSDPIALQFDSGWPVFEVIIEPLTFLTGFIKFYMCNKYFFTKRTDY